MLSDMVDLSQILLSFESVLKIEYDEKDIDKLIGSSIANLENAFGIRITGELYELQAVNSMVSDSINILLLNLLECTKSLSVYVDCAMYRKNIGISLASVNYLGFARTELITALKYLQDKDLYKSRVEAVGAIKRALSNISMCTVKRLFTVMLVLEKLGVSEAVSVFARFLYLGGLTL